MEAEDPQSLLQRLLADWRPDLTATLLFLTSGDDVLLIRKKRGHGAGKINGPGGKLDAGESPTQCAVRETLEETGVEVLDPQLAAVMRFVDLEDEDWLGYVFVAHRYRGKIRETVEAVPVWFARDEIPFDEMWQDDRHWLPRILAGEVLRGDFLFRAGTLIAHRLQPLGREEAGRAHEQSNSVNPELLLWD
jgi:8-oxo-dGTP diphosphatase